MSNENNPVNDSVRVKLHSKTFVLPAEEAAFQEELTRNGIALLEGIRTGAIRPRDGHRPELSHQEHKPQLADIALGRYQVDVTLFTVGDLRFLADHMLRELSHIAREMSGYHPIYPELTQEIIKKRAEDMTWHRSVFKGFTDTERLTDTELEGVEVYELIEKPSFMKEPGEEAFEAVLVTNWNQGFLLLRYVAIAIDESAKTGDLKVGYRKISIEDAVRHIVDWRDFVRFINRLQGLFRVTDARYKRLLHQIRSQSFYTLTANLIHNDPDALEEKVTPQTVV